MLKTHYRQPINWTRKGMVEAALELNSLRQHLAPHRLPRRAAGAELLAALADDLNTPSAIAELHRLARATLGALREAPRWPRRAWQTARARFANALATPRARRSGGLRRPQDVGQGGRARAGR